MECRTLKLCNTAAYQFILHHPLTDLTAITESIVAQISKTVCFKMSVTAGLKAQEGLPSLDGDTQHVSSQTDNNAVKL
jgi:hypothetical protein